MPVLTATAPAGAVTSRLDVPVWRGFRCRVQVIDPALPMRVDLRTKPADPATSVANGGGEVSSEGNGSLLVPDDSYEGTTVSLVLLDGQGQVVAKQATTVGGD